MIMKKIISIVLLIAFALSLTACTSFEAKEITCEELIAAYKEAGYSVGYHNHDDPVYYDLNMYCSIEVKDPDNPEKNYLYITRFFTEEDAEAYYKEQQFNPILWLFFGVFGEWRWLHVKYYGDIVYSTFDTKMLFPMYKLILSQ